MISPNWYFVRLAIVNQRVREYRNLHYVSAAGATNTELDVILFGVCKFR